MERRGLGLEAVEGVPHRVTLNEAVELAKKYGAAGSARFVNGILDRVASELRKGQKQKTQDREPAAAESQLTDSPAADSPAVESPGVDPPAEA